MTTDRSSSAIADDPIAGAGTQQDHPLAEAGKDAGETAGHLAERATEVGFSKADQARQQTAEGLGQLASSVRRVSTDMESEQPMIANLADTAAEQTERIAGFLRETDARELVHTVEDVARRQPLLFVGGAFLLGVAASRFIKAAGGGSSGRQDGTNGSTYRSGIGAGYRSTAFGVDPVDEGLRP